MRTVNDAGLSIIRNAEGLRLKAYRDAVGKWTIGYGHLIGEDESHLLSASLTVKQAEELLSADVAKKAAGVAAMLKADVTDNQFSALVSLAYNIGLGALKGSTLLRLINEGSAGLAAHEFPKWNKAGGRVLPGLVTRRAAERTLYQTP